MTKIQKLAWVYAAGFLFVVIIGYVPGLTNDQGLLLGSFKIDPIDDINHSASGVWAAVAAWKSVSASVFYFKVFGIYYTADAFVGFFTGFSILDIVFGNWEANDNFSITNFGDNFAVNLPHFIIGPSALIIGFILSRKFRV